MKYGPIIGRNISIVDFAYYLFMATVPLEFLGTMYFNLWFSLSVPTGLFFIFSYLFLQKGNNSIHWPWPMNLPLIWLFITLVHYFTAPDLQYIGMVTGVFNNLVFSIILYNYLRFKPRITSGLLVMGIATGIAAGVVLLNEGLEIFSGNRFTLLNFDENNLGSILALGSLILVLHVLKEPFKRRTIPLLGLAVMCMTVVVSTGSRGAMLAFILALIFYSTVTKFKEIFSIKKVVVLTSLILASIILYQQSPVTRLRWESTIEGTGILAFSERNILFKESIKMIKSRPIMGWGLEETFSELGMRVRGFGKKGTHNTFLMVLVTTGLVGGLPFLAFMMYPFAKLRSQHESSQYKNVLILLFFILMVFMSLDWLNRKQMWIFYSMALAHLSSNNSSSLPSWGPRPNRCEG